MQRPRTCLAQLLALFLALVTSGAARAAGNGAIAYAQPLEGVTVDGDLTDWPESLPRYPLSVAYFGNAPKGAKDFEGWFQVAYDPEAGTVLVAAQIEDEAHLVEAPGRDWWNDDSCVLYFDPTHSPKGSGPVALAIAGSRRELSGHNGIPWDPAVVEASWDDADGAIEREGTRTTYEWAVKVGRTLSPGDMVGMDLVAIDLDPNEADEDGSYLAWGTEVFKNRAAGRCGAVLLVGAEPDHGTLRGSVRWEDDAQAPLPACVRIHSQDNGRIWLDAAIDAAGRYELELPPGSYTVEPGALLIETPADVLRVRDGTSISVRIESGEVATSEPLPLELAPRPDLLGEVGVLRAYGEDSGAAVDRFVSAWMDYYQIPGVSLALVKDGERVHHKSYGSVNAFTDQPVTNESLFEAASITKCVFAFAVLRLAERGVIDLDRPLHLDLPFPELQHDERHKLLTARIVLSHRSGLPNWRSGSESEAIPFRFTPGTSYAYSGEAIEYLGRVAAHLDGRSLDRILEEEALEPMGFSGHTYFKDGPELRRHVAWGHWISGPTRGGIPAEVGVAHSMHSNAGELSAFLLNLLAEEGLDYPSYADMLGFEADRPADEIAADLPWRKGFGLGFMLMESPYGLVFGHDGNNGDFRANFEAYRDLDAGYVVFANHSLGGLLSDELRKFLVTGRE